MTTTSNTKTITVVSEEKKSITEKPVSLYEQAVMAIMDETGCVRREAVAGITFIQNMATKARTGARLGTVGVHHLTWGEMDTVGYRVMDDIMPHGQTAVDGSAHAAVQAFVLGPEEFALTHDNPTGQPQDCVVTVNIGFIS